MDDSTAYPHLEVEDIVRISGSNRIAVVRRVADDSDDEDDSIDEMDEHPFSDAQGRLSNWFPPLASTTTLSQEDVNDYKLISNYDDDEHSGENDSTTDDGSEHESYIENESDDESDDGSDDGSDDESDDESDDQPSHHSHHQVAHQSHHRPPNLIQYAVEEEIIDASNFIDISEDLQALPIYMAGELPSSHAVLLFPTAGYRRMMHISQLNPIDRSFDIDQHVSWAPGYEPTSSNAPRQSGRVVNITKFLTVRRITDITADTVHHPDPATCFEIPCDAMGFFSGLRSGDAVVKGRSIGILDYYQEEVFVEFHDGSIALVPGHRRAIENIDIRTPDVSDLSSFSEGLFYPGQRVRSDPHIWRTIAEWIRGSYSGEDEGVVKYTRIGKMGVDFHAVSMFEPGDKEDPSSPQMEPSFEIVPYSDVTVLESFQKFSWTVGDRGYLRNCSVNGHDDATVSDERKHVSAGSYKPDGRLMRAQRRARERNGAMSESFIDSEVMTLAVDPRDVVQVVHTRTLIDILWQDGTLTSKIPSLHLKSLSHPDSFDFWPGDLVSRANLDDDSKCCCDESCPERSNTLRGCVLRVNEESRTAVVSWQEEECGKFKNEEELSVYELKSNEYSVEIGDTVLRIPQKDTVIDNTEEFVGIVTNKLNGEFLVTWNGGSLSTAPPWELLAIAGNEDTDDSSSQSDEEYSDDSSRDSPSLPPGPLDPDYERNWGSEDINGSLSDEKTLFKQAEQLIEEVWREDRGPRAESDEHQNAGYGCGIISMLLSSPEIYQFANDIGMQHLKRATNKGIQCTLHEVFKSEVCKSENETDIEFTQDEQRIIATQFTFTVLGEFLSHTLRAVSMKEKGPEIGSFHTPPQEWLDLISLVQESYINLIYYGEKLKKRISSRWALLKTGSIELTSAKLDNTSNQEVTLEKEDGLIDRVEGLVSSCETDAQNTQANFDLVEEFENFYSFPGSSTTKGTCSLPVVQKEWTRLKNNLPEGFIVRACEAQLGQLRAGVVGPASTPYSHVIFFFDIRLGSGYPQMPPQVRFHSLNRRLNPNLYEDGNVCLSILGTWDGDDVESWNAKTSNLLRLLLSLQALVFVEEPYFNEAGYGKHRGTRDGEENSKKYNESALLLSIQYAIDSLKPGNLPKDCHKIAKEHYKQFGGDLILRCNGLIGEGEEMENGDESRKSQCSVGFKKALKRILGSLRRAVDGCKLEENN